MQISQARRQHMYQQYVLTAVNDGPLYAVAREGGKTAQSRMYDYMKGLVQLCRRVGHSLREMPPGGNDLLWVARTVWRDWFGEDPLKVYPRDTKHFPHLNDTAEQAHEARLELQPVEDPVVREVYLPTGHSMPYGGQKHDHIWFGESAGIEQHQQALNRLIRKTMDTAEFVSGITNTLETSNTKGTTMNPNSACASSALPAFQTKHFVYGQEVSTLTEDQLIQAVRRLDAEIADLASIQTPIKKVAEKITSLQTMKASIVDLLGGAPDPAPAAQTPAPTRRRATTVTPAPTFGSGDEAGPIDNA